MCQSAMEPLQLVGAYVHLRYCNFTERAAHPALHHRSQGKGVRGAHIMPETFNRVRATTVGAET